jgi:hypothetical protein
MAKKAKKAAKKSAPKKVAKKTAVKKATPKPKKAVIKTTESSASVEKFLHAISDTQKRADSFEIVKMMEKASGAKAKMWGSAIIGFGNKVYTSPNTGRQVDWFYVGFSPRKANLTLYLTVGTGNFPAELKKLGKHKTGGGCLYINKLSDVDTKVLQTMIDNAVKKNK